jgi:DNA-binding LacI/PurR family transcriptional regulator
MQPSYKPIYQRLFEYYKSKIIVQEYAPGQQVDSINKMMARHNISRETAKLILKMLTSEKLVYSKAGKGSFVAPFVNTKKEWGMVIPFYSSNIEQLINYLDQEAQIRERKLTYFIDYNNPEEEMRIVGSMINEGFEAVIIVPNYNESLTAEFYRRLIPGNTCVVLVDNTMSGSYFKYVVQSYDLGVKRAVDYLTLKTQNNLLLVKNDSWKGRNMLYELMENTFFNLINEKYPKRKAYAISNLKQFSKELIVQNNIGGILCCSDTDAIRVIGRLKKWQIAIPETVSIVSYGNTELTEHFSPAITVIDCLYQEMALQTARLIEKGKLAGPYEQHIIQPLLIERET